MWCIVLLAKVLVVIIFLYFYIIVSLYFASSLYMLNHISGISSIVWLFYALINVLWKHVVYSAFYPLSHGICLVFVCCKFGMLLVILGLTTVWLLFNISCLVSLDFTLLYFTLLYFTFVSFSLVCFSLV